MSLLSSENQIDEIGLLKYLNRPIYSVYSSNVEFLVNVCNHMGFHCEFDQDNRILSFLSSEKEIHLKYDIEYCKDVTSIRKLKNFRLMKKVETVHVSYEEIEDE